MNSAFAGIVSRTSRPPPLSVRAPPLS